MKALSPTERRALRARAHSLHPVVAIGNSGLSPTVLAEIDRSLKAHELIKVRVFGAERDEREALLAQICEAVDAAPVQHIGNILVVYREKPEEPAPQEKPARKSAAGVRRTTPPPSALRRRVSPRKA
jgi:putative YhbY family RNA-binding protein